MATQIMEMEGTWEEIAAHAVELAGRRLRLIVLPGELRQARLSLRSPRRISECWTFSRSGNRRHSPPRSVWY